MYSFSRVALQVLLSEKHIFQSKTSAVAGLTVGKQHIGGIESSCRLYPKISSH